MIIRLFPHGLLLKLILGVIINGRLLILRVDRVRDQADRHLKAADRQQQLPRDASREG